LSGKRQRFIYVQHRRVRLLLVALVAVFAAAGVTGAAASPPTEASGTFTTTSATFNSMREVGGNTIIDLSSTIAYTGTFTGTSTVHGLLIFHSDGVGPQFPPWRANFHDVEIFTGTVNGVPGTVTFNLNGSSDPSGAVKGTDTIVSATGELAGLHGVLSQVGKIETPSGPFGTYTGQIQFGSP
jgi:Protein of unknown function (DUF3224)